MKGFVEKKFLDFLARNGAECVSISLAVKHVGVAELADALALGASDLLNGRAGSSPASDTTKRIASLPGGSLFMCLSHL